MRQTFYDLSQYYVYALIRTVQSGLTSDKLTQHVLCKNLASYLITFTMHIGQKKSKEAELIFWPQVSGFLYLVSGIGYLVSGIWYLVSGIWYLVSGIWYLLSGIWYLVSGIWYLVSLVRLCSSSSLVFLTDIRKLLKLK